MAPPTSKGPQSAANGKTQDAAMDSNAIADVLHAELGEEEEQLFHTYEREQQKAGLRIERVSWALMDPIYKRRNAALRPKIPKLWLIAIMNHGPLNLLVSPTGDVDALSYLREVTVTRDEREHRAYRIDFAFDENPYFSNPVLTKTYAYDGPAKATAPEEVTDDHMDFDSEHHINPGTFTIDWKAGKSLTKALPRPKDEEGDDMEPGSFFHLFEVAEDQYGIGAMIAEEVYPDVMDYFMNKGEESQNVEDDDITDEEEEEDEEDDAEIDLERPPKKRARTGK